MPERCATAHVRAQNLRGHQRATRRHELRTTRVVKTIDELNPFCEHPPHGHRALEEES